MKRALLVVATELEAARLNTLQTQWQTQAVRPVEVVVVVSGVGAVAAALATQAAIQASSQSTPPNNSFDLVLSVGIGGAFESSGLKLGSVAVASQVVQADLGAWDGSAFLPLSELKLEVAAGNAGSFATWPHSAELGLPCGAFVTVNSVTGSAAGASELLRRVPNALIEGMEGAGVAHAALLAGVAMTEVRGVSNVVGPRERSTWRIAEALAALDTGLERVLERLAALPYPKQHDC